jgi:hypothetical protein
MSGGRGGAAGGEGTNREFEKMMFWKWCSRRVVLMNVVKCKRQKENKMISLE